MKPKAAGREWKNPGVPKSGCSWMAFVLSPPRTHSSLKWPALTRVIHDGSLVAGMQPWAQLWMLRATFFSCLGCSDPPFFWIQPSFVRW